jgi:hypothetical protein
MSPQSVPRGQVVDEALLAFRITTDNLTPATPSREPVEDLLDFLGLLPHPPRGRVTPLSKVQPGNLASNSEKWEKMRFAHKSL